MENKVFISSTVYDLIDIRSELRADFEDMGLEPIMSDVPDSKFEVLADRNSIETCLVNLEKFDHVIIILSQRYGPSLKSVGFEDYSATHLEYLHAIKQKKKIHMYVRDRLAADFSIWKKNKKKTDIKFTWVDDKNLRIFDILDEHQTLVKEKPTSNWYKSFRDSVDLRKIIRNDFNFHAAQITITRLLSRNEFPLLQPALTVELVSALRNRELIFRVKLRNVSYSPAFNFCTEWLLPEKSDIKANPEQVQPIIAPGQEFTVSFLYGVGPQHKGTEADLLLKYSNVLGYEVNEIYSVKGYIAREIPAVAIVSGCQIKQREFKVSKPFEVQITK